MATETRKFGKISTRNNWMTIEYYLTVGSREVRFNLNSEDKVWVQWPDLTEEQVTIVIHSNTVMCPDMGHSYPTTQHWYGFDVSAHGAKAWVPLTEVQLEVQY